MIFTLCGPSPLNCSFLCRYRVSSSGRTAITDSALGRGSEVTSLPQISRPRGTGRKGETGSLKGARGAKEEKEEINKTKKIKIFFRFFPNHCFLRDPYLWGPDCSEPQGLRKACWDSCWMT